MVATSTLRQQRDALYRELKALGKHGEAVALKMRYATGHHKGSRERVIAETEALVEQYTLQRGTQSKQPHREAASR